ncbi:hypothetical protein [Pseudomonas sp. LD120]|uniref:hypothetical protein n=1 Tax=Pseudomonas sp. LD120 TaxID=485751 RepID=UPI001357139E|nr:hypothetical protein [Pseudomonas sp. LD120]KAF0862277.1 hypothetical protein PLD_16395 [Pseudomonas sp. LD120]
MTRYLLCPLLLLACLLTGCANKLEVAIAATPAPDYYFDLQAPVLVTVNGANDAHGLNASYYVRDMVAALHGMGFKQVYTEASLPKNHPPFRMNFTLDVGSEKVSYRYTATDYGQVPSSTKTVCKQSTKKDKNLVCNSTPTTTWGPVGSSERTGYTTLSTFNIQAKDEQSRRTVFLLRASSYNEDCQDAKVEDFLVQESLDNLDFRNRVQRKYTVTLPEGHSCN